MGLQSAGGLGTRVLFLNVFRGEKDRLTGIHMATSLGRFLGLLWPEEVVGSENRERLRLGVFMYHHPRAAATIRRVGVWYVLSIQPLLVGFWRVGW